MEKYNSEFIKKIHHWNNKLFTIYCTRSNNFKFKYGEFILIGLKDKNNNFISRAYSITSSIYENYLEFLSIKVENGLFTSKLKKLNFNNEIYLSKKPTGTLLLNNLKPGGVNLWLISTGTGISPFISIINDPSIYNFYKNLIFIHSVNFKNDLSYRYYINNIFFKNFKIFKKYIKFLYYPIVTKEIFLKNDRITNIIKNKKIFYDLKIEEFDIKKDRIMICGNIKMIKDIIEIIEKKYDFTETKSNSLAYYVTEKAFLS